jgi:hypothetical protein
MHIQAFYIVGRKDYGLKALKPGAKTLLPPSLKLFMSGILSKH